MEKYPFKSTYARMMSNASSQFHGSRKYVNFDKANPLATTFIANSTK